MHERDSVAMPEVIALRHRNRRKQGSNVEKFSSSGDLRFGSEESMGVREQSNNRRLVVAVVVELSHQSTAPRPLLSLAKSGRRLFIKVRWCPNPASTSTARRLPSLL